MKTPKKVCGVGVNDSKEPVQRFEYLGLHKGKRKYKRLWICPVYEIWKSMLTRCYGSASKKNSPSYSECSVSDNWLIFSEFFKWASEKDYNSKFLDKDLKVFGNKVYSKDTCMFVSREVNNFIKGPSIKDLPVGVSWDIRAGKYRAYCSNVDSKQTHLGYFASIKDARMAWAKAKFQASKQLADRQECQEVAGAIRQHFKVFYDEEIGNG